MGSDKFKAAMFQVRAAMDLFMDGGATPDAALEHATRIWDECLAADTFAAEHGRGPEPPDEPGEDVEPADPCDEPTDVVEDCDPRADADFWRSGEIRHDD